MLQSGFLHVYFNWCDYLYNLNLFLTNIMIIHLNPSKCILNMYSHIMHPKADKRVKTISDTIHTFLFLPHRGFLLLMKEKNSRTSYRKSQVIH